MAKYILDTNTVSAIESNERIADRLARLSNHDSVATSVVTLYEAKYGLKNTSDEIKQAEILQNIYFLEIYFEIIPLDTKEADIYADLKIIYKQKTGISSKAHKKNDIDLLIASSAIANNAILVSADKIFQDLSQMDNRLQVQNWMEN